MRILFLEDNINLTIMSDKLISTENMYAYQRRLMKHDGVYHPEIVALGVSRRMNHIALHLIKYLGSLASLPISAPENKKALIDSFIMIVSASNLLGIPLAKDLEIDAANETNEIFINVYIQLLAELAKACEATDHQEDYPIRSTWNKNIRKFFLLIVQEASSRNISILEDASYRLASVERKNSLDHILQEKKMSFWSSQTLESRLPDLIEPFSKDCIESASYELSLGEEVHISALPDTPHKDRKPIILKEKETVVIPPGQFAFLITLEKVSIPNDAIAFISMKFGIKAKGLINVSGFHVDPGYTGRLIFAVYNAGPLSFQVKYGQRLFVLWLADLNDNNNRARETPGYDSIPTSLTNGPEAVSSLPSLLKRLDKLEKKVEKYTTKQAIVWAIALSITLLIAKYVLDRYLAPLLGQ